MIIKNPHGAKYSMGIKLLDAKQDGDYASFQTVIFRMSDFPFRNIHLRNILSSAVHHIDGVAAGNFTGVRLQPDIHLVGSKLDCDVFGFGYISRNRNTQDSPSSIVDGLFLRSKCRYGNCRQD